jgi:hypothetical protein
MILRKFQPLIQFAQQAVQHRSLTQFFLHRYLRQQPAKDVSKGILRRHEQMADLGTLVVLLVAPAVAFVHATSDDAELLAKVIAIGGIAAFGFIGICMDSAKKIAVRTALGGQIDES